VLADAVRYLYLMSKILIIELEKIPKINFEISSPSLTLFKSMILNGIQKYFPYP
jgi:hypothetical protein